MAPRDPKLKPYRAALWAIYFVVILVPIGLVVTSVVRHLRGPHRPAAESALPTRAAARVCAQELEALNADQNRHAWTLGQEIGEADAVARFLKWSQAFEQRVDDLGDRCHLDGDGAEGAFQGRAELVKARDAVLALHRVYRAQANRFAQEGADAAKSAASALAAAKDAVRQP
ncbi:MAG TPA: hypothetical protein VLT47_09485 [Anaeromyxobacteraceae bacterium]|nr:hypothetical protein [Anaeromyxobacteraceae bacterium]